MDKAGLLPFWCALGLHWPQTTEQLVHPNKLYDDLRFLYFGGSLTRYTCRCGAYRYRHPEGITRWLEPYLGDTDPLTPTSR